MFEDYWKDFVEVYGEEIPEEEITPDPNLENLWEECQADPILFIPRAYASGSSVQKIQGFLESVGYFWTLDQIYKLLDY